MVIKVIYTRGPVGRVSWRRGVLSLKDMTFNLNGKSKTFVSVNSTKRKSLDFCIRLSELMVSSLQLSWVS